MKEQVFEILMNYPMAWIVIILLAPLAIGYRYRKFMRSASHASDSRSIAMLVVGFIGAALILWAILQYT